MGKVSGFISKLFLGFLNDVVVKELVLLQMKEEKER